MNVHNIAGKAYALETCPACGVQFAIPAEICEAALRVRDYTNNTRPLFCPDGHKWHYVKPTESQRDTQAQAELTRLAEHVVDLEEKLAASEALVKQLGGNVTALHIRGAR